MSRLTFSPLAISDIEAIWDYTAKHWGLDQADQYTDDIRDVCIALSNGSKSGRHVDVRDGYLKHPAGSHFVFYRHQEHDIKIIRILHQSMDVARHL